MKLKLLLPLLLAVMAMGTVRAQKDTVLQVTSNWTVMPVGFSSTVTLDTVPVLRMVSDTSFHRASYSVWAMRMYEVREVYPGYRENFKWNFPMRHIRYLDLHYSRLNEHLKVWETMQ